MPKVEIDHASTFRDAKEILSGHVNYDAVLLDLSLPDSSGEELVKDMVKLVDSCPIIVLTGFADKDFSVRTLSMGISDYLLKEEVTSSYLFKSITYSIERERINQKIKDSEEKYRSLFDFSPQPMWVFEFGTLKFLNVNKAAIDSYGFTKEEFLSMTIKDIRPKEDIPHLEKAMSSRDHDALSNAGIFKHLKKNGEIIDVDIQSSVIHFENKTARLVLATDVSERLEYVREIEKQNKMLHDIAWTQSHVVRAPLARIMGLVNILNKDLSQKQLDPGNIEVINHIQISANELDEIVRGIVRKTQKVEQKISKV